MKRGSRESSPRVRRIVRMAWLSALSETTTSFHTRSKMSRRYATLTPSGQEIPRHLEARRQTIGRPSGLSRPIAFTGQIHCIERQLLRQSCSQADLQLTAAQILRVLRVERELRAEQQGANAFVAFDLPSGREALALAEHGLRAPLIEVVDLAHLVRRSDPAQAVARARQARLLPQLGAALLLLERCAAAARRFGGAEVDPARIPRLDLPGEVARAVEGFELSAEPARPGALLQVARALGLVAEQGSVE